MPGRAKRVLIFNKIVQKNYGPPGLFFVAAKKFSKTPEKYLSH